MDIMASKKVCVVTGGNKGIGYGIVKDMCTKFNGVVYLTARSEERGQSAVESLKKLGLSPVFHQLDIEDKASVDRLVKHIKETHGGLDVLVNNAAHHFDRVTAPEPMGQQAEVTIRINYICTVNVFKAFLPLYRPHARVVNVSSSAGHLKHIPGEELRNRFSDPALTEEKLDELMREFIEHAKSGDFAKYGWPPSTYMVSKVGLSAATRLQQKIFDSDPREDLVVNNCHPGYVDTDMSSHKGRLTIEEGAVCPVYLALLPSPTNLKGKYFWFDTQEVDWTASTTPTDT